MASEPGQRSTAHIILRQQQTYHYLASAAISYILHDQIGLEIPFAGPASRVPERTKVDYRREASEDGFCPER
jgi:hypothetical protein